MQLRQPQVARAHRFVESGSLLLHPVGRQQQWTRPLVGAQETHVRRQVEQERHVRPLFAGGEAVDDIDHRRVEPPRHALVNGGRIQEAVAHHDAPARQRGVDRFAHQLRAARGEKQEFCFGRHAPVRRGTPQQAADFLAQRRAAGFAQEQRRPFDASPPVRRARRRSICVDFPQPSEPSKVMKMPRSMPEEHVNSKGPILSNATRAPRGDCERLPPGICRIRTLARFAIVQTGPACVLPAVSIYFLEVEPSDASYFENALAGRDVHFAAKPGRVGAKAEVVSVFIHTTIDRAFLDAHPALRLVATRSTGCEHIDLAACHERGVAVANVPSYGEHTVAEHTFALILALSRRLFEVTGALAAEGKLSYAATRAFELRGKTLGVIGAGRIGRHVITIAQAFGMKVLAFDIHTPAAVARHAGFDYAPLDRLLAEAHILTLHVPVGPDTHHLLNRDTLARCRPGVLVINTSRGALIDTDALLDVLDSAGRLPAQVWTCSKRKAPCVRARPASSATRSSTICARPTAPPNSTIAKPAASASFRKSCATNVSSHGQM